MENVVRNNFAGSIGSGRSTGIDNNASVSANEPVISKMYEREAEEYCRLNDFAVRNGIVLFGSTFAKEIPVGELRQAFNLDCNIYNRSFADVSVFDVYTGSNIKDNELSIAFSLTFKDELRTLTDEEVMNIFNNIIKDVTTKHHAVLRDN